VIDSGGITGATGGTMQFMLLHCVDESVEFSPGQEAEIDASTAAWAAWIGTIEVRPLQQP
jgi:hypothetical protein